MLPELELENLSHEELINKAKQRRSNPTIAEKLLWRRLGNIKIGGHTFCRQAVRRNYIFDFYCSKLKLLIEIDYSVGNLLTEYYQERDVRLQELGYRVLRFKEVQVLKDFSSVINQIDDFIWKLWISRKKAKVSNIRSGIKPISSEKNSIPGTSPCEKTDFHPAGENGLDNQNKSLYFSVSQDTRALLIEQAKEMRKNPTIAEALLWGELKAKKLAGYKFRRQHPLGSFIVDFYCPSKKLVIEVDGPFHANQTANDRLGEVILQTKGYQVLRFSNDQVEHHLNEVLEEIRSILITNKE